MKIAHPIVFTLLLFFTFVELIQTGSVALSLSLSLRALTDATVVFYQLSSSVDTTEMAIRPIPLEISK